LIICIIGILAAILTPVMMRARFKAYHTACVQNERNLMSALELYSIEYENIYPADLNVLTVGSKPYIQLIETCPTNGASYADEYTTSPDGSQYVLACPGTHELQLVGMVQDLYPQGTNGEIYPYGPP
jgi:type II secretory pathway pseudopilin PulG